MNWFIKRIIGLSRNGKRLVMVAADALLLPVALWSAIILRQYPLIPDFVGVIWLFITLPLLSILVFVQFGLYRVVVRYMEDKAIAAIVLGVSISAMILVSLALFGHVDILSRASYVLYWILALLYVGGSRILARAYLRRLRGAYEGIPVAIYGAGRAGAQLLQALRLGYEMWPAAFFDDDADLKGSELSGVTVFPLDELADTVDRLGIRQILLAMPSLTRQRRQEILASLEPLHLQVKTIPSLAEIATGRARVDEVRQVAIEELLGREPVAPDQDLLSACIRAKSVMVTGAGGSIGAELCRQVLRQGPSRLVLFDVSEYAIYRVEQELQSMLAKLGTRVEIVPMLGSVMNQALLEAALRAFAVQTVYHAAAYKHVPLVEYNVVDGVRNNVFGTWFAALAARTVGVDNFILVSTDKAVRPTNVMGASKRLAELALQALAETAHGVGGDKSTRYCMVRFGNVLGSSGSVVPLFEQQIRAGGPVTITHLDVTRYFMTIPEAAQLVIQAGAMGQGGDVFVLDMGQPLRIYDLAERMIHLSGFNVRDVLHVQGDIEIVYTGLRPGEKLYEELLIGKDVAGTSHPRILRVKEKAMSLDSFAAFLERLHLACTAYDCLTIRHLLLEAVEGYEPQCGIEDFLWRAAQNPLSENKDTAGNGRH